jgi:hypothetical protein
MSVLCPLCAMAVKPATPGPGALDASLFECPRCGNFMVSGTALATVAHVLGSSRDNGAKLSHAARRAHEQRERLLLTTHVIEAIVGQPLPRPREQADLLLRWIAENVPGPGQTVRVNSVTHAGIVGSTSLQGFELVLDHLFDSGLVTGRRVQMLGAHGHADATLSFSGWDHYENLRSGSTTYRRAFMAMKFGDEVLDSMLENIFKPSAKRAGFDLVKLTDVPKAGLIDDRMRVEIQAADFVVADLSHDNLGAYWEAGYAEGLGKPVIYTCEQSKFQQSKTHFDTNHHLTILWDASAPSAAGRGLTATIRATLPHLAKLLDDAEQI